MSHHLRQYSVLLLNVKCAFNPLSWRELVRCCIILILGRDVHVNIYQILQINCICIPYEEQIILCRGQVNSWSRSTFCYKTHFYFTILVTNYTSIIPKKYKNHVAPPEQPDIHRIPAWIHIGPHTHALATALQALVWTNWCWGINMRVMVNGEMPLKPKARWFPWNVLIHGNCFYLGCISGTKGGEENNLDFS
jgi:hypothetical protein